MYVLMQTLMDDFKRSLKREKTMMFDKCYHKPIDAICQKMRMDGLKQRNIDLENIL